MKSSIRKLVLRRRFIVWKLLSGLKRLRVFVVCDVVVVKMFDSG